MNIAIYQINPDRDENNVAFLNYENLERFQGSAELRSEIYDKVFEGEVELHLPGDSPLLLNRSQAMVHDRNAEEPLRPVPFDRSKFVRQLPNRDFPWSIHSSAPSNCRRSRRGLASHRPRRRPRIFVQ